MRAFIDATGGQWVRGELIGKVGAAFTSTASQHGGQETTLLSLATFFLHQGMVFAGVPYSARELLEMGEITGGSPYGASTVAGDKGQRLPSDNELGVARAQGRHVATLAAKIKSRPA
jgi:NAD(P)H dehydrogenase (quinone)